MTTIFFSQDDSALLHDEDIIQMKHSTKTTGFSHKVIFLYHDLWWNFVWPTWSLACEKIYNFYACIHKSAEKDLILKFKSTRKNATIRAELF